LHALFMSAAVLGFDLGAHPSPGLALEQFARYDAQVIVFSLTRHQQKLQPTPVAKLHQAFGGICLQHPIVIFFKDVIQ
jgi:hypothetical protein